MKVLFFSLAFVVAVAFGSKCSKSNPQLESCLLNKVEALRYDLMSGTSKINLPALDPFKYDYFETNYANTDIKIYDVKAEGVKDFEIKHFSIKTSDDSYKLEATVVVPILNVRGDYVFEKWYGVKESGHLLGLFYGVKATLIVIAKPKTIHGRTYLKPDQISTQININDGYIKLDGGWMGSFAEYWFRTNKRSVFNNVNSMIRPIANRYIKQILKKVPVDAVLSK